MGNTKLRKERRSAWKSALSCTSCHVVWASAALLPALS